VNLLEIYARETVHLHHGREVTC